MNMRMVGGVMESRVPFEVRHLDLVGFGNRNNIASDGFLPCLGVVVAEAFRVLAA